MAHLVTWQTSERPKRWCSLSRGPMGGCSLLRAVVYCFLNKNMHPSWRMSFFLKMAHLSVINHNISRYSDGEAGCCCCCCCCLPACLPAPKHASRCEKVIAAQTQLLVSASRMASHSWLPRRKSWPTARSSPKRRCMCVLCFILPLLHPFPFTSQPAVRSSNQRAQ